MPAAFIPSPSRGLWHIGPVPIRGYALCVVLGIVACLWLADRRYRRIGGRAGLILDVATLAVPFGLIGARAYGVLTGYHLYFGHGRDWANVLRIWDGAFGVPGGVAAGGLGAWIACRRHEVRLSPVAGAAAPGLAFAAAMASWGNWFSQQRYGRPATVPWALEIGPQHRVPGFENFATFQPAFLYESIWDVLAGMLVILAARRFVLTGDRTFAVYAGLQAIGTVCTGTLRIGYAQRLFGLPDEQIAMIGVLAAAVGYLHLTRARKAPDVLTLAEGAAPAGREVAAGNAEDGVAVTGDGDARAGGGTVSPSFH
jgi:prolipoprotein diacylglyceryltransferase